MSLTLVLMSMTIAAVLGYSVSVREATSGTSRYGSTLIIKSSSDSSYYTRLSGARLFSTLEITESGSYTASLYSNRDTTVTFGPSHQLTLPVGGGETHIEFVIGSEGLKDILATPCGPQTLAASSFNTGIGMPKLYIIRESIDETAEISDDWSKSFCLAPGAYQFTPPDSSFADSDLLTTKHGVLNTPSTTDSFFMIVKADLSVSTTTESTEVAALIMEEPISTCDTGSIAWKVYFAHFFGSHSSVYWTLTDIDTDALLVDGRGNFGTLGQSNCIPSSKKLRLRVMSLFSEPLEFSSEDNPEQALIVYKQEGNPDLDYQTIDFSAVASYGLEASNFYFVDFGKDYIGETDNSITISVDISRSPENATAILIHDGSRWWQQWVWASTEGTTEITIPIPESDYFYVSVYMYAGPANDMVFSLRVNDQYIFHEGDMDGVTQGRIYTIRTSDFVGFPSYEDTGMAAYMRVHSHVPAVETRDCDYADVKIIGGTVVALHGSQLHEEAAITYGTYGCLPAGVYQHKAGAATQYHNSDYTAKDFTDPTTQFYFIVTYGGDVYSVADSMDTAKTALFSPSEGSCDSGKTSISWRTEHMLANHESVFFELTDHTYGGVYHGGAYGLIDSPTCVSSLFGLKVYQFHPDGMEYAVVDDPVNVTIVYGYTEIQVRAQETKESLFIDYDTRPVTSNPTSSPSLPPTPSPTAGPSMSPTVSPTMGPSTSPTVSPTMAPTNVITSAPTTYTTMEPSDAPSTAPSMSPVAAPTTPPTMAPVTKIVSYSGNTDTFILRDDSGKVYHRVVDTASGTLTLEIAPDTELLLSFLGEVPGEFTISIDSKKIVLPNFYELYSVRSLDSGPNFRITGTSVETLVCGSTSMHFQFADAIDSSWRFFYKFGGYKLQYRELIYAREEEGLCLPAGVYQLQLRDVAVDSVIAVYGAEDTELLAMVDSSSYSVYIVVTNDLKITTMLTLDEAVAAVADHTADCGSEETPWYWESTVDLTPHLKVYYELLNSEGELLAAGGPSGVPSSAICLPDASTEYEFNIISYDPSDSEQATVDIHYGGYTLFIEWTGALSYSGDFKDGFAPLTEAPKEVVLRMVELNSERYRPYGTTIIVQSESGDVFHRINYQYVAEEHFILNKTMTLEFMETFYIEIIGPDDYDYIADFGIWIGSQRLDVPIFNEIPSTGGHSGPFFVISWNATTLMFDLDISPCRKDMLPIYFTDLDYPDIYSVHGSVEDLDEEVLQYQYPGVSCVFPGVFTIDLEDTGDIGTYGDSKVFSTPDGLSEGDSCFFVVTFDKQLVVLTDASDALSYIYEQEDAVCGTGKASWHMHTESGFDYPDDMYFTLTNDATNGLEASGSGYGVLGAALCLDTTTSYTLTVVNIYGGGLYWNSKNPPDEILVSFGGVLSTLQFSNILNDGLYGEQYYFVRLSSTFAETRTYTAADYTVGLRPAEIRIKVEIDYEYDEDSPLEVEELSMFLEGTLNHSLFHLEVPTTSETVAVVDKTFTFMAPAVLQFNVYHQDYMYLENFDIEFVEVYIDGELVEIEDVWRSGTMYSYDIKYNPEIGKRYGTRRICNSREAKIYRNPRVYLQGIYGLEEDAEHIYMEFSSNCVFPGVYSTTVQANQGPGDFIVENSMTREEIVFPDGVEPGDNVYVVVTHDHHIYSTSDREAAVSEIYTPDPADCETGFSSWHMYFHYGLDYAYDTYWELFYEDTGEDIANGAGYGTVGAPVCVDDTRLWRFRTYNLYTDSMSYYNFYEDHPAALSIVTEDETTVHDFTIIQYEGLNNHDYIYVDYLQGDEPAVHPGCDAGEEREDGECIPCGAGDYSTTGLQCYSCLAGSYSQEGASECTLCPDSTYSRRSGASECEVCETAAGEGNTECAAIRVNEEFEKITREYTVDLDGGVATFTGPGEDDELVITVTTGTEVAMTFAVEYFVEDTLMMSYEVQIVEIVEFIELGEDGYHEVEDTLVGTYVPESWGNWSDESNPSFDYSTYSIWSGDNSVRLRVKLSESLIDYGGSKLTASEMPFNVYVQNYQYLHKESLVAVKMVKSEAPGDIVANYLLIEGEEDYYGLVEWKSYYQVAPGKLGNFALVVEDDTLYLSLTRINDYFYSHYYRPKYFYWDTSVGVALVEATSATTNEDIDAATTIAHHTVLVAMLLLFLVM